MLGLPIYTQTSKKFDTSIVATTLKHDPPVRIHNLIPRPLLRRPALVLRSKTATSSGSASATGQGMQRSTCASNRKSPQYRSRGGYVIPCETRCRKAKYQPVMSSQEAPRQHTALLLFMAYYGCFIGSKARGSGATLRNCPLTTPQPPSRKPNQKLPASFSDVWASEALQLRSALTQLVLQPRICLDNPSFCQARTAPNCEMLRRRTHAQNPQSSGLIVTVLLTGHQQGLEASTVRQK